MKKEIVGEISLLFEHGGCHLELYDANANVQIFRVTINRENTCKMLSRQSNVECYLEYDDDSISKLGKIHLCKRIDFELGENHFNKSANHSIKNEIIELIQKSLDNDGHGWIADKYLGSQNSFSKKDGKYYAHVMVRKWVDEIKH